MKTIENILHLYLGCDVKHNDSSHVFKLTGYDISTGQITLHGKCDIYCKLTADYKPILRPLDSMTEEEAITLYDEMFPDVQRRDDFKAKIIIDQVTRTGVYYEGKVSIMDYVNWFPWLLSKSFDLFGLIDSGLALDATKLEGYASKI